jgi:ATP-dependent Clp protease ATP-binding subunit ClpX
MPDVDELRCSFCGKPRSRVGRMVCGPTSDIAICNECVALVTEIMREEAGEPEPADRPPGE